MKRVEFGSSQSLIGTRGYVPTRRATLAALVFAVVGLGCLLPAAASAEPRAPKCSLECEILPAQTPSENEAREYEGSGEQEGFTPQELRSAYKLPEMGGSGTTIAIVDGPGDPNAEADLKEYRKHYGLPACTAEHECFRQVNERGEASKPTTDAEGWSEEISLDLDMVSAACGECHILLVEAKAGSTYAERRSNREASDKEAAKLGASVITNSWNDGFERNNAANSNVEKVYGSSAELWVTSEEESTYDKTFESIQHEYPDVPLLFAGGDYGYAVRYPAISPHVISVGGTKLTKVEKPKEGERAWSEEVWFNSAKAVDQKGRGSGSGCSLYEEKPKGEADTACKKRIQNDVAAEASTSSPVSVYDSYEFCEENKSGCAEGWRLFGGTSASSPFVAGVEGLSNGHSRSLGAEAFYLAGKKSQLYDVTKGHNGTCTPPTEDEYWCTAEVGLDGPTGNGTPDGALAITVAPAITTGSATGVKETEATLHGTVNPNGTETKYYFEYGETTSYGKKTAEVSAGAGESSVEVSKTVTGLTKSTSYDYRIVATNTGSETSKGANQVFTTHPYWSLQELPSPTGVEASELSAVSCVSASSCASVGYYRYEEAKKDYDEKLAVGWNGKEWAIQKTPKVEDSFLEGVSCTASNACTAVGRGGPKTLAERWNGTEWSTQTTPNPNPVGIEWSELSSVSCTSSEACMAVGQSYVKGTRETLAESWNGKEWLILTTPNREKTSGGSLLTGVSCTSSTACTAVGETINSGIQALAERWNGTEWTIQTTPGPTETSLTGASCTAANSCTAVGLGAGKGERGRALAESWNGKEWLQQSAPTPETTESRLSDVSCTSSTDCTAAGYFVNSLENEVPLAEAWNGTAWSPQQPPSPTGSTRNELFGISCTSVAACTSVGRYTNSSSKIVMFAERYE
jgi:hypothetical protein